MGHHVKGPDLLFAAAPHRRSSGVLLPGHARAPTRPPAGSTRPGPGNPYYLEAALGIAAMPADRTKGTYLAAMYRRIAFRRCPQGDRRDRTRHAGRDLWSRSGIWLRPAPSPAPDPTSTPDSTPRGNVSRYRTTTRDGIPRHPQPTPGARLTREFPISGCQVLLDGVQQRRGSADVYHSRIVYEGQPDQ